jgi:hypothetical protein
VAGVATASSSTLFTPAAKKYYGSSASNVITSSELIAGSSEFVTASAVSIIKSSFTIAISGGSKYIYFAYPVKYVDKSTPYQTSVAIWVGGFESTGSFDVSTKSITNAQGYKQDYYIYVWKNTSSANITNIEVKDVK